MAGQEELVVVDIIDLKEASGEEKEELTPG